MLDATLYLLMNSDVLIIGGGVIGLSIARELHKRGVRRITIVDRGPIGRESSWAAAGMLAPNIETGSTAGFHRFGRQSLELYPAFSDALFEETGVDIELDRTGTLCVALTGSEDAALWETYRRQTERSVAVKHLSAASLHTLEPETSTEARGALFYSDDWQVENRKLLDALQRFARLKDIRILENTQIDELLAAGRRVTGARTGAGDLAADITVLATGAWTSLIKIGDASMPISVKPIRGQMISYHPRGRLIRHVVYGSAGYLVPRSDGRILVGATVEDAGFDKATTPSGIDSLRIAAIGIAPQLSAYPITESWAGLRPFAADGLPVLGEIPGYDNVFVASAHYRNGILLAPKTAEMITKRILGGETSGFLESFGVERFAAAAAIVT